MSADQVSSAERARRWRLVLGDDSTATGEGEGGRGDLGQGPDVRLSPADRRLDATLAAVYGPDRRPSGGSSRGRRGGLGRSAPQVAHWLGEVRECFPRPVVEVVQRDAVDRLGLHQLLLEPELLQSVVPDLALVELLVGLSHLLPETSKAAARAVVEQVVDELRQRFEARTVHAVHGALRRSQRVRRPPARDIDWDRTIRANLRHWIPETSSLVPEHLVGHARRQRSLERDVIVAIDQSASMAESVIHAAVLGSVLARLPSLQTRVVAFDTSVVDLTPVLHDPVELLFGVQLGGGTDIGAALAYCRSLVERPERSVVVLISDLFDGGQPDLLVAEAARLVASGVTVLVLLALGDGGTPTYDHHMAGRLAALGVPSMACTPDEFPDVLAAALEGRVVTGL